MKEQNLDVVGYWSEVKLEIVRKYASAYSTILTRQEELGRIRRHLYIDAFAGAGKLVSRRTGGAIPGSAQNALEIKPPFSEYHFIDIHEGKAESLRHLAKDPYDVAVYEGDCNKILIKDVFPRAKREDYHRALCLLDPYGLHLKWSVMEAAGKTASVEIFLNFPVMDMNRNILWRNPDKVQADQAARMDFFWGDRSWREAAYKKSAGLFGEMEEKEENAVVAEAFGKRLQQVAGFEFVAEPMPMRNTKGNIVYYLFFASPNATGAKIVRSIFNKYRDREG